MQGRGFDPVPLLGVVGAVLILFARLIDQIRALEAELDEIV